MLLVQSVRLIACAQCCTLAALQTVGRRLHRTVLSEQFLCCVSGRTNDMPVAVVNPALLASGEKD